VFLLEFAARHGLAVYIICVLAFLVFAALSRQTTQGRESPLPSFKGWFLLQIAALFLFGAFSALVGQIPWMLIIASVCISFAGFLVTQLLASLAGPALRINNRDAGKLQAVIFAEHMIPVAILGLGYVASVLVNMGLLIWSGFAFDAALEASPVYQAKIALYILILPTAMPLVLVMPLAMFSLMSKYSTPAYRNLTFVNATLLPLTGSVNIFGPYYVYRRGFEDLGIALPSMSITALAVVVGGAFLLTLVLPFVIGHIRHARLAKELRHKRTELLSRALTISDWREDSAYRATQLDELCDNIVREFDRLQDNLLLRYFSLTLFAFFLRSDAGTPASAQRAHILWRFGFGPNSTADIEAKAEEIKATPAFQRPPFSVYIEDVEKDARGLPAGHPLESHFLRLTEALHELVNLNPDFKYMCGDWLTAETEENLVVEAKPALAFTALSAMGPLYGLLGRMFDTELRMVVSGTIRWLHSFWVVLFGAT
jgi:hypothetical protein